MQSYKNVICLILGGGQGKRLYPLTRDRSKPAVPFAGKYRLIDIPISNCINAGMRRIYVLTQFNSASLNNHIYQTYRFDHFADTYIDILAAEQTLTSNDWFQGTADAVRKNLFHLELQGDEEILILSGDHLYRMDYRHILKYHRENNADITISAIPVTARETSEFGILQVDGKMRINSFKEKPSLRKELANLAIPSNSAFFTAGKKPRGKLYLASMGVYVFKASVLLKALLGPDMDFGKEIIPHSISRFRTFAYPFDEYWQDIGTIRAFYTAHMNLLARKPSFLLDDHMGKLFTHPRFLPPGRISNSTIDQSLMTEGCSIEGASIYKTIVGLRTNIKKGSKISRSVIMGADFYQDLSTDKRRPQIGIGPDCSIDKAIIDKNTRIGKNVTITNEKKLRTFDGPNFYIRGGIVIIPKNAYIPDNTTI